MMTSAFALLFLLSSPAELLPCVVELKRRSFKPSGGLIAMALVEAEEDTWRSTRDSP